jgi:shikimate kinase
VVLSKAMGMDFIDTDLLIQKEEGKLLQEIIDEKGIQEFL